MAQVVWTEPALADLEAIADYIAVENPEAASSLVQRVFAHIDQLQDYPRLGPVPPDLEDSRYRHIIESPCRIFYRQEGQEVFIVHVMRSERFLTPDSLDRG